MALEHQHISEANSQLLSIRAMTPLHGGIASRLKSVTDSHYPCRPQHPPCNAIVSSEVMRNY